MATTLRLRLFNRLVNPGVRAVLRHRPHGRLAGAVALLSYRGTVSGRSFTLPVEYARDAGGRYVIVPGEPGHKNWWRNFRSPVPVRLLAAGHEFTGQAALISAPAERRDALAVYYRRFPGAARAEHLTRPGGGIDEERLASLAARQPVIQVRVPAGE